MGARLLRAWLLSPLRDPAEIAGRLDAVEVAVKEPVHRAAVRMRSTASATSSGWPDGLPRAAPIPANLAPCETPSCVCRGCRTGLEALGGPLTPYCAPLTLP